MILGHSATLFTNGYIVALDIDIRIMAVKILGQSKVYSNFKITIKDIADKLKIKEGDRVILVEENGRIEIRKMKP